MRIVQVNKIGTDAFRIIPDKGTLTLDQLTKTVKDNIVFVQFRDIDLFEANGYQYADFPMEDIRGTDFINFLKAITAAEVALNKKKSAEDQKIIDRKKKKGKP
jgi:hypothetical protein